MPMILIFSKCGMHVINMHLVTFIRMRDFYSREINFVPIYSIRELLVKESHGGGLMGYFGLHETLGILNEHFYYPNMKQDVLSVCAKCDTCR